MAKFKITLELDSFRGGWTESFYLDAGGPAEGLVTARGVILSRMACSPPSVLLIGLRIAQYPDPPALLPTPRVGALLPGGLAGGLGTLPKEPDLLQNKAMLDAFAGFVARRKFWIGGMADAQTKFSDPDGASIPGPQLGSALDGYRAALVAAHVQIRGLISPTVLGYEWANVNGVTGLGVAGNQITFTLAAPATVAVGDFVTFGKIDRKIFPGLVGNWPVVAVVGSDVTIQYYNNFPVAPLTKIAGLRLRKVGTAYNTVSGIVFDSFRAHKVGKSLGESRGRAKAVSFRR